MEDSLPCQPGGIVTLVVTVTETAPNCWRNGWSAGVTPDEPVPCPKTCFRLSWSVIWNVCGEVLENPLVAVLPTAVIEKPVTSLVMANWGDCLSVATSYVESWIVERFQFAVVAVVSDGSHV
jgi:hypothetical protein